MWSKQAECSVWRTASSSMLKNILNLWYENPLRLCFLLLFSLLFLTGYLDSGPSWQYCMGCNLTVWVNVGPLSRLRERLEGFNLRTTLIVHICGLVATRRNKHPVWLSFRDSAMLTYRVLTCLCLCESLQQRGHWCTRKQIEISSKCVLD